MEAVRCLWKFCDCEPETVECLSAQLGLSALMAQCLYNRGVRTVEEAQRFLYPYLKNLGNPFDLPEMEVAVKRLLLARERGEEITIFGDYDVDGITASAVLSEFFRKLGWNCAGVFLPLRMEEGYGLSEEGLDHCLEQYPQTKIFLAVDCGSTSAKSVQRLQTMGVDVIVLDHHQVDRAAPPRPHAFVNPQNVPAGTVVDARLENLQNLCSAGMAFKLAHALLKRGRELGEPWGEAFDLKTVLDLVALGTIADMVKLVGENRIFVAHGIKRIAETERPGLRELLKVSKRRMVSVYDVSFYLTPRLNAAGRIEDAQVALDLLTTQDEALAVKLALQLDQVNSERKGLQNRIADEVIERVKRNFNPERDYIIVEGSYEWHLGVIGIAAAQIVRQFHRPVIILGGNGQNWRGSCRSIEGFDMADALNQCEGLLLNHGGHSMAAGVEVELNKLGAFREKINQVARACLENRVIRETLSLDAKVGLRDIVASAGVELFRLAPFGMGNQPLSFVACNVWLARPPKKFGQLYRHLKLFLTDDSRCVVEGVIWNFEEDDVPPEGHLLNIAFEPTLDFFNGQEIVRLRILDWELSQK